MDPELFPERECRLLLVGKTGNGKSSTGNSILGRQAFKPKMGINSGTPYGKLKSGGCKGVKLQVMDTPGLHDTQEPDSEINRRIACSLLAISPGPHAVILCLSCEQRFTKQEMDVVETLKHTFGENLMSYFVVVMVKGDVLEKHHKNFEEQLEKSKDLKQFMMEINHRYVVFDNRPELEESKKKEQLQCLLGKVMEVVRDNGRQPFRHILSVDLDNTLKKMVEKELTMLQNPTGIPDADKGAPEPPEEEETDDKAPYLSQSLSSLQIAKLVGKGVKMFESKSPDPHCLTKKNKAAFPSSKRRPGRVAEKVPAADGNTAQNQIPKVPPKPRRMKMYQIAEREHDDQLRDTSKSNSEHRAAEMEQGGSAPSRSFEYEVPDKPGMNFKDKQVMAENGLKRRLARCQELTAEQEEEVKKVSRPLGETLREGMKKFAVEKLSVCRLM